MHTYFMAKLQINSDKKAVFYGFFHLHPPCGEMVTEYACTHIMQGNKKKRFALLRSALFYSNHMLFGEI